MTKDKNLIVGADNISGHDIDWNATVRELSPGLLSYFQVAYPRQVAADLVQEVFLRMVLKVRAGTFDREKGNLRMYAYGIARLVRLEGRRKEISPVSSFDPDAIAHANIEQQRDDQAQLRWAVSKLKPVEQDVILLLLDRDLSLTDIGILLNMPAGTVKSHMHRAKVTLKEILQPFEKTESR
jgi:RNA polymerase sigma-70 factor (ECF subfamily)